MRLAPALLAGLIALSSAKSTSSQASSSGNDTIDDDDDRGHPVDDFQRPPGRIITPPPLLLQQLQRQEHDTTNTTAASTISLYPIGGTPKFVIPQISDQPQNLYLSYFPIASRQSRHRRIVRDDVHDILYEANAGVRQLINTRDPTGSFDYGALGAASGFFYNRRTGLILNFSPPQARSRYDTQNLGGLTYGEALAVLQGLSYGYETKEYRQEAKICVFERGPLGFDTLRGFVRLWYYSNANWRE